MIECRALVKEFGRPPQRVLHGIDLEIQDGEFISITGRSGSGKSTLLYLLSSLDTASSGLVFIDGQDVAKMSSDAIHDYRNRNVGFIFQFHFLLPELTTLENVLLPARNIDLIEEKTPRAMALLEELGIAKHAHKYPGQMSGGEQQRVAIARALILSPKYIFADEPTGNLDTANANMVMAILQKENKQGTTIFLVTHESEFAALASREVFLQDGRIVSGQP